jgi:hypothetical protein
MSYRSYRKEGDGGFLLVIWGSTRHASYLTGWQEFKDHIRKVVKEQPGWVEVYASRSQKRGEMQVWTRLRDKEDADAAYSMSSPKSHPCHLLTASQQRPTPDRKDCSCIYGRLVAAMRDCKSSGVTALRCFLVSQKAAILQACAA